LSPTRLRFIVHLSGGLALLAYFVLSVASFVQAPALWQKANAPRAAALFDSLSNTVPVFGWHAQLFSATWQVIASHILPLAVATLAIMVLLLALPRFRHQIDESLIASLYRWAIAFVAMLAFAYPVFTQDLWLSAVWGRMAAAGTNPYAAAFPPEALSGLPLDHFPMPMSYGPLWAVASAFIMFVSGGSLLTAFILLKAILVLAWLFALRLVYRISADAAPLTRALALVVFGWLPVGVVQALAEGHNDIVMATLALLWLSLLLGRHVAAPIALAASALCKYTTAPLFLVDLISVHRAERMSWRDYRRRMVLPAILTLATFALFVRSFQFFDGTRLLNVWRFLQPRDAVLAIDAFLGGYIWPLAYVATAVFPLLAAWYCARLWVEPNREQLIRASLAVMCAATFSTVAHLWPWYLVWLLPFAALSPGWWLARFVTGVALLMPFTVAIWWIPQFDDHKEVAALILYLGAIGWTAMTRADLLQPAVVNPRQAYPAPAMSRRDLPRSAHSQTHSDAGQEV
jgi:alpha-1,6-mannosyltransferase